MNPKNTKYVDTAVPLTPSDSDTDTQIADAAPEAAAPTAVDATIYAESLVGGATGVTSYKLHIGPGLHGCRLFGKNGLVVGQSDFQKCPLAAVQNANRDRKYRTLRDSPHEIENFAALSAIRSSAYSGVATVFSTSTFADVVDDSLKLRLTASEATGILESYPRIIRLLPINGIDLWLLLPGNHKLYKKSLTFPENFSVELIADVKENLMRSFRLPPPVIGPFGSSWPMIPV